MTAILQRSISSELEQIFTQRIHTQFTHILDLIITCAMLSTFNLFSFSVCVEYCAHAHIRNVTSELAQVNCTAGNSCIFHNFLTGMHVMANLVCIHTRAKVKFAKGKYSLAVPF